MWFDHKPKVQLSTLPGKDAKNMSLVSYLYVCIKNSNGGGGAKMAEE